MSDYLVVGIIYKIFSTLAPDVWYVGSTILKINERYNRHTSRHIKKDKSGTTVSKIFNKYGIETCKYDIIESFLTNKNKIELEIRESEIIKANKDKCVNKSIPTNFHNPDKSSKAYINKHKIINCLCGSKVKKQNYRDHIHTKKHKDDDSNFLTESLNYFYNNVCKHT